MEKNIADETPSSSKQQRQQIQHHKEGSVRHAEKRRTGTCAFADRVATLSIEHYAKVVPSSFRASQKQTCVATILAHFGDDDTLVVLALGVGTKFLPHALLQGGAVLNRVRDCHAEVLAKRAFRRYLYEELQRDITHVDGASCENRGSSSEVKSILKRIDGSQERPSDVHYRLKDGVTVHMYCSSAPCGNATLKRFAKMAKETFNSDLKPNQWQKNPHEPVQGHSIPLGQFALLVKLDRSAPASPGESAEIKPSEDFSQQNTSRRKKNKLHPAMISDNWCPPGTSTVTLNKGSIHTCSDKICRWNCLGLQGALLSSFIGEPIYLSTITVARKFTKCICQRALCCRAAGFEPFRDSHGDNSEGHQPRYTLNHATLMGTGVYMDESGVLEMKSTVQEGANVMFESRLAWAHCRSMGTECIDGASGFVHDFQAGGMDFGNKTGDEDVGEANLASSTPQKVSKLSSAAFVDCYKAVVKNLRSKSIDAPPEHKRMCVENAEFGRDSCSLSALREFKRTVASRYENAKDKLLHHHPVFRDWKRRELQGNGEKSKSARIQLSQMGNAAINNCLLNNSV